MSNAVFRSTARALLVACALGPPARAAALTVPKGTEVIDVDFVPGKFGVVHFEHAKHNDAFQRPDGSPVRCKDCHHKLPHDEPTSASDDLKCTGCHARHDDTPKTVGAKVTPPLATLRPDGAIEYQSILFHEWCWACHHKTMRDGHRNDRCKLCHERGVGSDSMHGRYDAVRQPGTRLSWMHCSSGQRWNGKACEGDAEKLAWAAAAARCPEGYRLPTRAELDELLGTPPPLGGSARACRFGETCAALFGTDEGPFWTSDAQGEAVWTVKMSDGAAALAPPTSGVRARCVRTESR
jgi:Zn finger protein HypA/HybF involved in hydrogenase expression